MPGKTVRWFKRIRTRGKQFDCAPRMRPSRLLEDGVSLSRRDLTMVARHEMPGMGAITDPSGKGRYDLVPRLNHAPDQKSAVCRPNHTVPLGRALSLTSSRHFMLGYLHSVPSGRRRLSLRSPMRRYADTPYLMPVSPFLVTRKFPEGFAEVRCTT